MTTSPKPMECLRLGSFGHRETRVRGTLNKGSRGGHKVTRLGFNSSYYGEPTLSPRNPSFGFSDVPWQERVGMFV